MSGKFDKRNTLNDLTGKEWLKLTKSFWFSEKCKDDKDAFQHPAPFLIKDIEKLISLFTKKEMTVLDPFVGSGTTLIAASNLNRYGIGIDLNKNYKKLAINRLNKLNFKEKIYYKYVIGDSFEIIEKISNIDYIVTSPPYHNILRNNGNGLREKKYNTCYNYRNGARIGVEYYSDKNNDLGNQNDYDSFLILFGNIMNKAFHKLNNKKYCSIIISDFTINKKETCILGDIVKVMEGIGFEFSGTIVLLQDNKPLYPFGYPYAYKINHHHQNIINFRKC
ncbi:MAG: DNA methyltransferase [Deltaproteobacteria bacterium]|nr:DNA methyltransferase [Deltaproteobacteria bacterium]